MAMTSNETGSSASDIPLSALTVPPSIHQEDLETQGWGQKLSWQAELRRRVFNFTPSWFSVNMGTGIASILVKTLPYQIKHMDVVADSIFGLNVILFFIFFVVSLIRYVKWPTVWCIMIHHPTQSLFLGTFPMGLCTIVNMIVFSCVPAFGQRFATLAWVVWWITVALSLAAGIGIPFIVHTRHKTAFDQISGVWFLPVVTNVVCAATGGVVAEVLPPSQARITLVVSYILWGVGVPVSFFLMALYYARLAIYKLPPAGMIVSVFLPIGPCGQGAFGLLQLANVLRNLSRTASGTNGGDSPGNAAIGGLGGLYSAGEIQVMASAVYGCSIIGAFILWGVGLFWLVNAVMTIGEMVLSEGKIPFELGWWGFTFPIGVFATATTSLAKDLDSEVLRMTGTFFSLCVILLWLLVSAKTISRAWDGSIFV